MTTAALEDHAGFWKRVGAYILDAIILYIPQLIIQKAIGVDAAKEAMRQAMLANAAGRHACWCSPRTSSSTLRCGRRCCVASCIGWLYFAVLRKLGVAGDRLASWRWASGSPTCTGKRISFPRALGRYPAKFLSGIILGIGFLMVAWTQRKQGLHDMIVGTLVLNGRASEFKDDRDATDSRSFSA